MVSNNILLSSASEIALFSQRELPAPEKLRPLGQFSDFVVEDLPKALERIHLGKWDSDLLRKSIDDAWEVPSIQTVPETLRPIACLDLMLLQQACDHVGVNTPVQVGILVEDICRSLGRLNTFLYEDCVLSNPLTQDPRVFTNGGIGMAERDFLLAHALIEQCLEKINGRIQNILRRIDKGNSEKVNSGNSVAQAVLENRSPISAELQRLRALFLSLFHMQQGDFLAFRGYYMTSPRTGLLGPSGRFSAKFFLLRVLVEGSAIRSQIPTFYREVLDVFHYFPRGDREVLLSYIFPDYLAGNQISGESRSLLESFGGRNRPRFSCLREASLEPWDCFTGLSDLVAAIRDALDVCTSVHLGLVKKNIFNQNRESTASIT